MKDIWKAVINQYIDVSLLHKIFWRIRMFVSIKVANETSKFDSFSKILSRRYLKISFQILQSKSFLTLLCISHKFSLLYFWNFINSGFNDDCIIIKFCSKVTFINGHCTFNNMFHYFTCIVCVFCTLKLHVK